MRVVYDKKIFLIFDFILYLLIILDTAIPATTFLLFHVLNIQSKVN